jgi:hypothetical protein
MKREKSKIETDRHPFYLCYCHGIADVQETGTKIRVIGKAVARNRCERLYGLRIPTMSSNQK